MAKKKIISERTCIECKNCTDHYNIGYNGKEILGKCSVKNISVLLRQASCDKFNLKR